jgi:two-component system sensor histidine kinase TctE
MQLLLSLLSPLLVLGVVTATIAYFLAVGFANDAYDRELINSADSVAARLKSNGSKILVDLPPAAQAILRHNNRDKFYYQVIGHDGQRISGDAVLPGPFPNLDSERPIMRYAILNGEDVRVARLRVDMTNYVGGFVLVQVAETLHSRHQLAQQILLSIMVPQVILVLLGAFAVSRGVTKGLTPLERLAGVISSRSQYDLTLVSEAEAPNEVRPLIVAINELLLRLSGDIESQRRFVANAAHQFRTPLAALKTYIYCAKRLPSDKEMNTTLDKIDESTERMTHLSNKLLALAKAEPANRTEEFSHVDLNYIAADVTAGLVAEAAIMRQNLSFIGSDSPAIVYGDPHNLGELMANLIENAVFYSPVGAQIAVQIKTNERVTLLVQDNGPGIAKDERPRVFERFYRVLGTERTGSGLGLAIVREIALAHDAEVTISEGPCGKGTTIEVSFPHQSAIEGRFYHKTAV